MKLSFFLSILIAAVASQASTCPRLQEYEACESSAASAFELCSPSAIDPNSDSQDIETRRKCKCDLVETSVTTCDAICPGIDRGAQFKLSKEQCLNPSGGGRVLVGIFFGAASVMFL